jgi:hypothetical protein
MTGRGGGGGEIIALFLQKDLLIGGCKQDVTFL